MMNEHLMHPHLDYVPAREMKISEDGVPDNYRRNNVLRSDGSFHPGQFVTTITETPIIPTMNKKESVLKAMKRFKQAHPSLSIV